MARVTESPIVTEALARIQELSAAMWEIRAHHEPVTVRRWPHRRVVCRSCLVPHPCPTWRTLQVRRLAGCTARPSRLAG